MTASDLRDRVAFEQQQAASDGYGNAEGEFAEEFRRAAQIIPRLGGETVIAARLSGRQPVTIRVRQDSQTRQVDESWRVRDVRKGTIYQIRSKVDPRQHATEHGMYIDLLCEAGVAT